MLLQFAKNWDFKMRGDKKRQFQKGVLSRKRSVLLNIRLHKLEGSDYSSKKVRTPRPVFGKIRKNTHMSILSDGTDTINKKLAVFTYVYFFATEAQKSSKNNNSQPQLKNFTGSCIKKLISSVGSNRRDLYLFCYH